MDQDGATRESPCVSGWVNNLIKYETMENNPKKNDIKLHEMRWDAMTMMMRKSSLDLRICDVLNNQECGVCFRSIRCGRIV